MLHRTDMFKNNRSRSSEKKTSAASPFSRKEGWWVPIHMKIQLTVTNIDYYTLLLLSKSIALIAYRLRIDWLLSALLYL